MSHTEDSQLTITYESICNTRLPKIWSLEHSSTSSLLNCAATDPKSLHPHQHYSDLHAIKRRKKPENKIINVQI